MPVLLTPELAEKMRVLKEAVAPLAQSDQLVSIKARDLVEVVNFALAAATPAPKPTPPAPEPEFT